MEFNGSWPHKQKAPTRTYSAQVKPIARNLNHSYKILIYLITYPMDLISSPEASRF